MGMELLKQIPRKMALLVWDEVVEDKFREKTCPQKADAGLWTVGVYGAAYRNQLNLQKPLLLERLNQKLAARGCLPLKDLKFTLATGLTPRKNYAPPPLKDPTPWLGMKLEEEDKRLINKLAARVKDPVLRKKMRALLFRDRQFRKFHRENG